MNGENEPPRPESRWDPIDRETFLIHGQTLRTWHEWLCTDQESGEPSGHLAAPGSRYGSNGAECAWWALACEAIHVEANGDDDQTEVGLDFYMGLAVNDSLYIAEFVLENWHAVPEGLRAKLGDEDDVRELLQ